MTIPDGVTAIREDTFRDCTNLLSVSIPDSVSSIGEAAFWYCESLINVKIPDKVTEICDKTFNNCNSLISVTVSKNITRIGTSAFAFCTSLPSITIPNTVITIGDEAFISCESLSGITIPDSVSGIGCRAFQSTGLTSITIPNSISEIAEGVFSNCTNLVSVEIPDSVDTIGKSAFYWCTNLLSVEIPDSITSIGESALEGCTSLTDLTISKSITVIENFVFKNCSSLVSVRISNSVSSIGEEAFYGCSSLASVRIPDRVTSIGEYAFCDCTSLQSITIPGRVTGIRSRTFHGCENMTSIKIPVSVTWVEPYAFSRCDGMLNVYYGGSEEEWDDVYFAFSAGSTGNEDLLSSTIHYNVPMTVEDYYELTVAPKQKLYTLAPGEELQLTFSFFRNDEPVTDWAVPVLGSDFPDTVELAGWERVDGKWVITIKALLPGKTTLDFTEGTTGEAVTLKVDVVPSGIKEYIDNTLIQINGSGTAFAYYQGDPNLNYFYHYNAENCMTVSDEKGIIKVPLREFDTVGVHNLSVEFYQIQDQEMEEPLLFRPQVRVTPLEYSQEVQFSVDGEVGARVGAGVGVELGDFKVDATLCKIRGEVGLGAAITLLRSWEGQKETLELVSEHSANAEAGVESGITGEIKDADLTVAQVGGEAATSSNVEYGIRIENFSAENVFHQQALSVFILGEVLAMHPSNIMLKQFHRSLADEIYQQEGVDIIEGSGSTLSGSFNASLAVVEEEEKKLFEGAKGAIEGSVTLSQQNYDNGDQKTSTNYSIYQTVSEFGVGDVGLLGGDFLSSDVTVAALRKGDKKSLEAMSIAASSPRLGFIKIGREYTARFDRYVFEGETLDALMQKSSNIRSYVNGRTNAVGGDDLGEVAGVIAASEDPIEYSKLEKTKKLYSQDFNIADPLKDVVDIDLSTTLACLQSVDHTIARGYAINDEILLTSKSEDNSDEVSGKIVRIEDLIMNAASSLVDKVAKFFKRSSGTEKEGVNTTAAQIHGKLDGDSNVLISITCPGKEESAAWKYSAKVDFRSDSNARYGTAVTVGRPFVVSVKNSVTEEAITDLNDDPLIFTIQYMEEELQAAGISAEDIADENLSMYRYSDNGDYFELVGGVHDPENMTVTAEIIKPGQYVLAVAENAGSDEEENPPEEELIQEAITLRQDYVVLNVGQTVRLTAVATSPELLDSLTWRVEKVDDHEVISVEGNGNVTAKAAGTAYVVAEVVWGETTFTARCRVDVAEPVKLSGIQLSTNKLTTELYKTDYAEFEVLLQLPQNLPVQTEGLSASRNSALAQAGMEDEGIMIQDAWFAEENMAQVFALEVLDGYRLAVKPTQGAIDEPKAVKSSYTGSVVVLVQGEAYTSEALTLTVKKSMPKLKAVVSTFNSFYTGQTQKITITGGTVTEIYADESRNTAKTKALPAWLTLADGKLTLTEDAPAKKVSGKAYILVETEEWRIPVALTLSVKNSYKAPGLKLSSSKVTVAEGTKNIRLSLLPNSKKDILSTMQIQGVEAVTEGCTVAAFDAEQGTFMLRSVEDFKAGKVMLEISFKNTTRTVPLTLTVKTAKVSLKLSAKSIILNSEMTDSAVLMATASPEAYQITQLDYRLTDSKGKTIPDDVDVLNIRASGSSVRVMTTENTPANKTYKLYISAGGSKEVSATIKTVDKAPVVSMSTKGTLDMSYPENEVVVTAGFKNYASGKITDFTYSITEKGKNHPETDVTEDLFTVQWNRGTEFAVRIKDAEAIRTDRTYDLKLSLTLTDGEIYEKTITLKVKRTAVKLKLSATKLSLNKDINDVADITVTCTTKGYNLDAPALELRSSNGKAPLEKDKLNVTYEDGKLHVALGDKAKYGERYKLYVRANAHAPASTVAITIPAQKKSAVTVNLKTSGKLDVIRDGSAVTVTPSYKNCREETERTEKLFIYSSEENYTTCVNDLFQIKSDGKGGYTIAKAAGKQIDRSLKYKVVLETVFGENEEKTIRSSMASLRVTVGSAKLTLKAKNTVLFAKDKNDRLAFAISSRDAALNEAVRVEIKDSKYKDWFEVFPYGNGTFAIGFKDGKVPSHLEGKRITVNLNVWIEGNQAEVKANAAVKLAFTVR